MRTINIPKKVKYLSEKLKSELVIGDFEIDSKFLSIPGIVKKFNVSPVTAHKAAKILVKEGYLKSVARKGYFVASKPKINDIKDMFNETVTRRILFIVRPEDMDRGSPKVISGLQPVCRREKCKIEITPANVPNIVEEANSPDVVGVILEILDNFPEVNLINKPKICIGRWPNTNDKVASFIGDIEEALSMTVDYFHRFGHRKISVLIGNSGESVNEPMLGQIMAGYIRGMGRYHLKWDESLLYIKPEIEHHQLVREFIDNFKRQGITAIFVLHWSTLIVLLQELHRSGMDVPDDLSIIAYGESDFTPHVRPKMTRFELHIQKIAEEAARVIFLSNMEEGACPKTTLFPVELIEGESVKDLKKCKEARLWGLGQSPHREKVMKLMREKFGKEDADKIREEAERRLYLEKEKKV